MARNARKVRGRRGTGRATPSRGRRYPTLLELLHRGRRAALVGGSALALAGTGCPADDAGATDIGIGDPGGIAADPGPGPGDVRDVFDPGPSDPGTYDPGQTWGDGIPPADEATWYGTDVPTDPQADGGVPLPDPGEPDATPETVGDVAPDPAPVGDLVPDPDAPNPGDASADPAAPQR